MLSLRTKLVLAILHDIYHQDFQLSDSYNYPPSEMAHLLQILTDGHLIALIENQPSGICQSYCLVDLFHNISLLSVLEVLNEGITINQPNTEFFYSYYGTSSHKLGIVNQMARHYLMEISIDELPIHKFFYSSAMFHF